MTVEESLNVTFDKTPPPPKKLPLEDNDLVKEEAIEVTRTKPLSNDVEDKSFENNDIVNIKESKSRPLENVIVPYKTQGSQLKSKALSIPVDSSASSPMILMAESGTTRRPSNSQVKSWMSCDNFARGLCRFGSECRFVHYVNNTSRGTGDNRGSCDTRGSQQSGNTTEDLLVKLLSTLR
ncbi:retrovirus-related pol polyprotein from transposon TNT 1-94, partial [Tanacetum coccineum]